MTKQQTAFVLANVHHETAGFKYLKEIDGENQAIKNNYGGGKNWYGRGFIQLTHKSNYEKWSSWLNIDLVSDPDILVNNLEISALVACSGVKYGSFTGSGRVDKYINETKQDYYNAREIVNGDKNYRAGCLNGNCWNIGDKIRDLTNYYINLI